MQGSEGTPGWESACQAQHGDCTKTSAKEEITVDLRLYRRWRAAYFNPSL